MKDIWDFVLIFIWEIVFIILVLAGLLCFESFFGGVTGVVAFFLVYFAKELIYILSKPRDNSFLHLYGNNVCMRMRSLGRIDNVKRLALTELETIFYYAKKKGITKLQMYTFAYPLDVILQEFAQKPDKRYRHLCEHDSVYYELDVGRMKVTYQGQKRNTCARYQYRHLSHLFHIKKMMRKYAFYEIEILLI